MKPRSTPSHKAEHGAPALHYVRDDAPGLYRRRQGKGFVYADDTGTRVRDATTLARIASLAIPPAYQDVWICADPCGHLQATGRDARGRKQYRYHPDWIAARSQHKYGRLAEFGHALSALRRQLEADLARPGLGADKVLATGVALLDATLIRVGNTRYTRDNRSYGLTTLRNRHVDISGGELYFDFNGKSGVRRRVRLRHPQLARIVRRCQALPGQTLFQYLDEDGVRHAVTSQDVNDYLHRHAGEFTAKDCRTWAASVMALALCRQRMHTVESATARKRAFAEIVRAVAAQLGNTAAVCRKSYIHPAIETAFLDGALDPASRQRARRRLSADEVRLLHFLDVAEAGTVLAQ